jgi:hypothetical protein
MSNRKKDSAKYLLEYPSYLRANTRFWITQEQDLVVRDGKTYKVCQIVRPVIKGSKPKIVLEDYTEENNEWTIPF